MQATCGSTIGILELLHSKNELFDMYLFKDKFQQNLKVKICGISLLEDVRQCGLIGVNALGFLLGDSKGQQPTDKLTAKQATDLIAHVSEFTASVLLIKLITVEDISCLIDAINPDSIQIQNQDITLEAVSALVTKYPTKEFIKTIKIQPGENAEAIFEKALPFVSVAHAILLDSAKGGSGVPHDWRVSAEVARQLHNRQMPVILAGGLNPNNIKEAVSTVRPDMIDLMSGVSVNKGVKDMDKIKRLFEVLKTIK